MEEDLDTQRTRSKSFDKNAKNAFKRAYQKASTKAVFSVKKAEDDTYQIINFRTKEEVFGDLPFSELAIRLCERLNRLTDKRLPGKEFRTLIKSYYKYQLDYETFRHNMSKTTDQDRRIILLDRAELARGRMKRVRAELLDYC